MTITFRLLSNWAAPSFGVQYGLVVLPSASGHPLELNSTKMISPLPAQCPSFMQIPRSHSTSSAHAWQVLSDAQTGDVPEHRLSVGRHCTHLRSAGSQTALRPPSAQSLLLVHLNGPAS